MHLATPFRKTSKNGSRVQYTRKPELTNGGNWRFNFEVSVATCLKAKLSSNQLHTVLVHINTSICNLEPSHTTLFNPKNQRKQNANPKTHKLTTHTQNRERTRPNKRKLLLGAITQTKKQKQTLMVGFSLFN